MRERTNKAASTSASTGPSAAKRYHEMTPEERALVNPTWPAERREALARSDAKFQAWLDSLPKSDQGQDDPK